jgi:hypothetical protein
VRLSSTFVWSFISPRPDPSASETGDYAWKSLVATARRRRDQVDAVDACFAWQK